MLPELDCSQVLIDKNLKFFIEGLEETFQANRVIYGRVVRTGGQGIDYDLVSEDGEAQGGFLGSMGAIGESIGGGISAVGSGIGKGISAVGQGIGKGTKFLLPSSLFWDDMFMFMVTRKSYVR